jgi:phytoene synthase
MSAKPEAASPRFLPWLYSSASQQPVLAALCAIEQEIGASLKPGLDHQVAHTRLKWWREECERCAAGTPAHPLTTQLLAHLKSSLPAEQVPTALAGLSGLVDSAIWDLAGATFERRSELLAYCQRWSAAMIVPLALACGPAGAAVPPAAAQDARQWGALLRETELLGDLAREARAGRLRLPLDELEQAGITPDALSSPPWPPALSQLLRQRQQAIRRELQSAVASLSASAQQSARGLLVWTALAWQECARAERALPQPPAHSIASAVAANWRAWRAARSAGAGRFRLR